MLHDLRGCTGFIAAVKESARVFILTARDGLFLLYQGTAALPAMIGTSGALTSTIASPSRTPAWAAAEKPSSANAFC